MVSVQTTLDGARLEIEKVRSNLNDLERDVLRLYMLLNSYLQLIRRLGLDENSERALAQLNRVIQTIIRLRIMMKLMKAEMGPIGWTLLALETATISMDVGDMLYDSTHGE